MEAIAAIQARTPRGLQGSTTAKLRNRCVIVEGLAVVLMAASCAPNKAIRYGEALPARTLAVGEVARVKVLFNGTWRSSGVTVREGEQFRIAASGRWRWNQNCNSK